MADLQFPVGTIVQTLTPDQKEHVKPIELGDYADTNPPIGVLLSNAISVDEGGGAFTGGYCIVSTGGNVVIRRDATSPIAAPGDKLYPGPTPGEFTTTPPARTGTNKGPILIGRAHTLGPSDVPASRYCYAAWLQPDGRHVFIAATTAATCNTGDVVNFLSLPVEAGGYYLFELNTSFSCGDGGFQIQFVPSAAVSQVQFDLEAVSNVVGVPGLILLDVDTTFLMPHGAATGFTGGVARARGHFKADAAGTFTVAVSQRAANITPTVYDAYSYLRLHEQG
jgi:hypothetical protein